MVSFQDLCFPEDFRKACLRAWTAVIRLLGSSIRQRCNNDLKLFNDLLCSSVTLPRVNAHRVMSSVWQEILHLPGIFASLPALFQQTGGKIVHRFGYLRQQKSECFLCLHHRLTRDNGIDSHWSLSEPFCPLLDPSRVGKRISRRC